MTPPLFSRQFHLGSGLLATALTAALLAGCGSSEPANGTLRCGLSEPRCPSGSVCVAATDTCWKIGTYDGGASDGAASLADGASSEAGSGVDGASSDVPLPISDASVVDVAGIDAPDKLDSSLDQSVLPVDTNRAIDGAKDAPDANAVLDSAADGLNTRSCTELSNDYNAALAKAKVCTVGSTTPCGQNVKSGIYCGCNVPVNSAQTGALATMDALRKAWADKGCVTVCPAIACLAYKGAVCSADASTTGTCVGTSLVTTL